MKKALVCALFLLGGGCSGGSAAQETSTTTTAASNEPVDTTAQSTTTIEASPTSDATTTSTAVVETTVPFTFPDNAAEQLEIVQLSASDFGEGYESYADPESLQNNDQLCEGVDRLRVAMPPEADSYLQFEGGHLFFSNLSVYPTAAEAAAALQYLSDAYISCNGGTREVEGEIFQLSASAFSPAAILGSDQTVGLLLEQTTPAISLLTTVHLVTADRMLFLVGGTDPAVVSEMSDVLVSRTRLPAEPVQFSPVGLANVGPGYTNPAYYSFAEGPDQLRALPLSDGALRFLNDSSLERVDEVASLSCVLTQLLAVGNSIEEVDQVLVQAFSAQERTDYAPQALGEVYGAANAIYCPMLSEYLQQVLASAS